MMNLDSSRNSVGTLLQCVENWYSNRRIRMVESERGAKYKVNWWSFVIVLGNPKIEIQVFLSLPCPLQIVGSIVKEITASIFRACGVLLHRP
jgi:hypothetical protein